MLEAIDDAIASLGGPEVATAAAVRAAGGEVLQEVRYYQLQKLLTIFLFSWPHSCHT